MWKLERRVNGEHRAESRAGGIVLVKFGVVPFQNAVPQAQGGDPLFQGNVPQTWCDVVAVQNDVALTQGTTPSTPNDAPPKRGKRSPVPG